MERFSSKASLSRDLWIRLTALRSNEEFFDLRRWMGRLLIVLDSHRTATTSQANGARATLFSLAGCVLAGVMLAQMAGPAAARSVHAEGPTTAARKVFESTPGVNLELSETSREKRDGITNIGFQVVAEGAPPDKVYNLRFQDTGMLLDGQSPVPFGSAEEPAFAFRVDAEGKWTPELPEWQLTRFARGEWIRVILVSTDETVRAQATFVPWPIQARQGTCHVSIRLMSRRGTMFAATGEGFRPGESVMIESKFDKSVRSSVSTVGLDGSLPYIVLDPPQLKKFRKRDDHVAQFSVVGQDCALKIDYNWGPAAARPLD